MVDEPVAPDRARLQPYDVGSVDGRQEDVDFPISNKSGRCGRAAVMDEWRTERTFMPKAAVIIHGCLITSPLHL